jgi:tetratricopeptide (TPR) repeat protein
MVGRERQRGLLENAFANVVGERTCHLFTVLGTAGVGKSRLVSEFLGDVGGATVVRGRCLSYGEGISYWPVTEVAKQLGAEPSETSPLSAILGDEPAASSPEEIAWAFRKLLEERASERPLAVVFDDAHWGETVFLDLVEHVADFSRDAPILLLCLARPELLDRRPAWGGGKLNSTTVLLEPLASDETEELIDRLLPYERIEASLRERILEAAGGNPLFVEEMVAMLAEAEAGEDGASEVAVPPTIQALLAARLDQLDAAERSVLERGSVEGQVFHRNAVVAMAPEEPQVDGRLMTLVRKDLVRPERSTVVDDDAFRFRHLLIRDAAYESLPKATRAELHERFAIWLEEYAPDLVELDEIVGYHLEQAYNYRAELGPLDEANRALGPRAARHLLTAGSRAQRRGDLPAAEGLLTRAGALLPPGADQRAVLVDLAIVLVRAGDFARVDSVLGDVIAAAEDAKDERVRWRAELVRLEVLVQTDPTVTLAAAAVLVEEAAAALERLGDAEGVAAAWRLLGAFRAWLGKTSEADVLWERALEHAERGGHSILADEIRFWIAWSLWFGPTPASEGISRCDQILAEVMPGSNIGATALVMRGAMLGLQGRLAEARAEIERGRGMMHDLGQRVHWAGTAMAAGENELRAGDPRAAEAILRAGFDVLDESAETGYIASVRGLLAQALLDQGRNEEALRIADEARRMSSPDDFEPHARAAAVRAGVLIRKGDREGAESAIAEAEEIATPTEYLPLRMFVALVRAEVEHAAGRWESEREALEEAVRLSELKGDVVLGEVARTRLAELSGI